MARFWEIDALRGLAIIMMIIFHFLWNLKYFGRIDFDLYAGIFGFFQVVTAGLFLFVAGLVVAISAQNRIKGFKAHFLKRGAFIFGCGLLISAVTLVIFPGEFIYFGILHLIGVSIILSIPVVGLSKKKRIVPLVLGLIVIVLPLIVNLRGFGINFLVWVGFAIPFPTLDFEPVFPWFGAFLIGVFFGDLLYSRGKRAFELGENNSWLSNKLQFLGRHSLLIYLLHQVVMFGAMYLIFILFG